MDRINFQEILESTTIPDGMSQENMVEVLKPLNIALMQMIPDRLYKYRSCDDKHISALEKDELWLSTSDLSSKLMIMKNARMNIILHSVMRVWRSLRVSIILGLFLIIL